MAHRTQAPASIKHASAVDVYNLPLVEYWLVIDTRSAGAWKEGHIATAWSLPGSGGTAADAFARLWDVVYEENPPETTKTVVVYGDGSTGTPAASWTGAVCAALCEPATARKLRLQQVLLLESGYAGFAVAFPFLTRAAPTTSADSALCVPSEAESLDFLPASITPQLFLGSDAHAQSRTCFAPAPHGLGVTHVVNAASECPNYFDKAHRQDEVGTSGGVRSEEGRGSAAGAGGAGAGSEPSMPTRLGGRVTYLRLDWVDIASQDMGTKLTGAVEFIAAAHADKRKVLVHCHRGRSRSASVVLAYLMISRKWRLSQALDHVARCRPVAEPNEGFMRQLERLDRTLQDAAEAET